MKPDELTQDSLEHLRRHLRTCVPEPPPPQTFAGVGQAARRQQVRRWGIVAATSVLLGVLSVGGVVFLADVGENDSGAEVASAAEGSSEGSRQGTVTLNVASRPANFMMQAIVGGEVAVDAAGCVYLRSGTHRADVVWPYGFSGRVGPDGRVRILDETGRVVLIEGQSFSSGGGGVDVKRDAAVMACRAASGPVTFVQDAVRPD